MFTQMLNAARYGLQLGCARLLKKEAGEGYVDTGVKILISVVLGALILGGLYALFDTVIMPTLSERVTGLFSYGE